MSDRKRINISLDPESYEQLLQLKRDYKFTNVCELTVALIHIMLDRKKNPNEQIFDVPDDDGQYLDEMFEDLSGVPVMPNDSVTLRYNKRKSK